MVKEKQTTKKVATKKAVTKKATTKKAAVKKVAKNVETQKPAVAVKKKTTRKKASARMGRVPKLSAGQRPYLVLLRGDHVALTFSLLIIL